jgi:HlyD family secretion protein
MSETVKSKRRSWIKKSILALVAILLVTIIIVRTNTTSTEYKTEPVKRATITSTLVESGNVVASNQTDVYSTVTGTVSEVYVKNGDIVSAGQELFKVVSSSSDKEKATAYASYLSAVNAQKVAEQNKMSLLATLERDQQAIYNAQNDVNYKDANTKNPKTNADYTDLEKQSIDSALEAAKKTQATDQKKYDEAGSSIDAAKAQVNATYTAYRATQDDVITSSSDGTVGNVTIIVGSSVSAQSSASTSTSAQGSTSSKAALIVGDMSKLKVSLSVSEIDIAKITSDHVASITFDSIKATDFTGKVSSINYFGSNSDGIVTYEILVMIDAPPDQLKPAMSGTVSFEVAKQENVLTVSNAAIKPYQGGKAVEVIDESGGEQRGSSGQKTKLVPVKTGIKDATRTEILSGIEEGTQVIVEKIETKGRSGTGS